MNTNAFHKTLRQSGLLLACAGMLAMGPGLVAAESYDNTIDFALGVNSVTDNKAQFQKNTQKVKDGFGGIESLYVTKDLNDTTNLELKGRALAGDSDYLLDLTITKDDVGYLKFGYKGFREFYDGMGGYMPTTGFMKHLYNEDMHVDRGDLWFEAGYTAPDKVNFRLRYDLLTRKGDKDSTSWGDSNVTGVSGTKAVLPAFYKIDEKRHVITADLSRAMEKQDWLLGVRYDKGDFTNSKYIDRRAGESSDRKLTAKEGQDYDIFAVHGNYMNRISDLLVITTAVSRTDLDTVLSGSRIAGQVYDADFSPTYAGRQWHDEGFINQHGDSTMKQTVGLISAAYTPTKNLTIVPTLRFEHADWSNQIDFEETAVQSNLSMTVEEVTADSSKGFDNYTQGVEVRYKAAKDWNFNFVAELSQQDGDLTELQTIEPGTPAQSIGLNRLTNYNRDTAKYAATANWYPQPGTAIAVQYYYKSSKNDYNSPVDSTATYSAYINQQNFETNDFNIRVSKRLTSTLRSITRYDYQKSTIDSLMGTLNSVESGNMTTHMLAESIMWNIKPSWYVQGTVNAVWDTLRTPATTITGTAAGMVTNSDANYTTYTLGSGWALDKVSDLYVDYSAYEANNSYTDNSLRSVAFGTEGKSQTVSATWSRALNDRVKLTVKYSYVSYKDAAYGPNADYSGSLIYTKLQYRF